MVSTCHTYVTASCSQFYKNDEAKMTGKRFKVIHGKEDKETSGRCYDTLHPEASRMKNGVEMTTQGIMVEDINQGRITTGNRA